MQWVILVLGLLLGGSFSNVVQAYPSFIGYGYTSCRACHYNPLGNGPLTDYGRSVSHSEISGRLFVSEDAEKRSQQSGVLGSPENLPRWFRMSGDYRGNYLITRLEGRAVKQWIHMQAEGNAVFQSEGGSLFASGTYGYVPTPRSADPSKKDKIENFISREHYLGYRPSDSLGVYAGFMDVAFGLRIPDHIAYIRGQLLLGINDQTHGVLLHHQSESYELALHGFTGNLYQSSSLRQKGASLWTEFELASLHRAGISALYSTGTYRSRWMTAIHFRRGFSQGSSILAEIALHREKPIGENSQLGTAFFLQSSLSLTRGLFFLVTFEYSARDVNTAGARTYRLGPSLQWFPFPRLELRTDLMATRVLGLSAINPDSISLISQVHLWL